MMEANNLTIKEHLHELARRLLSSLIFLLIGAGITYVYRLEIVRFLQQPLHEQLYYTSPMGSFAFVMQLCLLGGCVIAFPVLLYNLIRYVEPAFGTRLRWRAVITCLVSSLILAAGGIAFGYYATLPFALSFFGSVTTHTLIPLISIDNYFGFVVGYLATFAILFQLPLIILFFNHIRPLKPASLSKWRKHLYVAAFAISIIMPSSPDPLSQISLAIPIIILYELSLILLRLVNRRHPQPKRATYHRPAVAMTQPAHTPTPQYETPVYASNVYPTRQPKTIPILIDDVISPYPQRTRGIRQASYTPRPSPQPIRRQPFGQPILIRDIL